MRALERQVFEGIGAHAIKLVLISLKKIGGWAVGFHLLISLDDDKSITLEWLLPNEYLMKCQLFI